MVTRKELLENKQVMAKMRELKEGAGIKTLTDEEMLDIFLYVDRIKKRRKK